MEEQNLFRNVGKTQQAVNQVTEASVELSKKTEEYNKFVKGLLSKLPPQDRKKVIEGMKKKAEEQSLKESVLESYDMLDNVNSYDDSELNVFSGLGTGCKDLDENYLLGFRPGQLIMLGGGSGLGKTTVMMFWCLRWIIEGHSIAWFALEDDIAEEMSKFKPMVRGRGLLGKNFKEEFSGEFKLFPIDKSSSIRNNPENFKMAVRLYQLAYKTDVVVLDMLNNVVAQNSSQKDATMDEFLHSLRDIAIELGITVFVTSMMREANGINAKEKEQAKYNPSYHEIYGMSTSSYAVQKVITLSRVPDWAEKDGVHFVDGQIDKFNYHRFIAIHVPKIRQGRVTPSGGNILEVIYTANGSQIKFADRGFCEW